MDPNLKAQFEKAAAKFQNRENEKQNAEQTRRLGREKFEKDWRVKCQDVICPALDEVAKLLKPSQWECTRSENTTQLSVSFEMRKKGLNLALFGGKYPSVKFQGDADYKTASVTGHAQSHDMPMATGLPLDDVTEKLVQDKALEIFVRVTAD
jgi:hypothetical protein